MLTQRKDAKPLQLYNDVDGEYFQRQGLEDQ
jgi:hypothetical protein